MSPCREVARLDASPTVKQLTKREQSTCAATGEPKHVPTLRMWGAGKEEVASAAGSKVSDAKVWRATVAAVAETRYGVAPPPPGGDSRTPGAVSAGAASAAGGGSAPQSAKKRVYLCSICRQPKSGHTCSGQATRGGGGGEKKRARAAGADKGGGAVTMTAPKEPPAQRTRPRRAAAAACDDARAAVFLALDDDEVLEGDEKSSS